MDPSLFVVAKIKSKMKGQGEQRARFVAARGNRNKKFYKEEFSYDVYYHVFGKMFK